MRRYFVEFILFFILLISCKKEEVKIPDTGRKIVINGLVTTDSLFGIYVCSSLYISDSLELISNTSLKNAQISIYENENWIDSLTYSKTGYLGDFFLLPNNFRSTKFIPKSGSQYKIEVKVPSIATATALTTIPEAVPIKKVDTSRILLTNVQSWQSNIRLDCHVIFSDPLTAKNFYMLYIFVSYDNYDAVIIYEGIAFSDPVIEEKINHGSATFGVAFSDRSFNGKQHQISVALNGNAIGYPIYGINDPMFPHHKTTIYFRLYSITEDYFKYIQTLNLFYKNYNNPLAEPTQVYSNVEGGYGIFAGAAVSSDSLVFTY